jgi:hypothetical protein
MTSIVLSDKEHQVFTKAWRSLIGYKGDKILTTTINATKQQVIDAAKIVYKGHPEILKALKIK